MFENKKFIINENGNNIENYIIKLCKLKDKMFVIYKTEDDENIYASEYKIINNQIILSDISDNETWDFLDKELNKE